jgi:hypothetical protein
MTTLFIVFGSIVLVFALYTLVAPLALNLSRFMGRIRLACPHRDAEANVKVGATQAALTTAYGMPRLRLRNCSLLRAGESCDEACLKGLPA